ncbi:hypothetical protein PTTG_03578 [Puccinia triticina 1-1 BBBD Race 1]|uniref:Uncharacterized protein n=1 Tax=Puccinia triticina (isolate 1-1 / race 1 (BBBD)) TaxID=630390 RepID=A0A0C4DFI3_PUCT1|nr:hypothetical protein PTTG_03578 [Puccinia triticina 1-1 BBBD Race 1]
MVNSFGSCQNAIFEEIRKKMHIDNKTERQEGVIRLTSVVAGVARVVEVSQILTEVVLARIEAAVGEIQIAEGVGVQIEVAVDDVLRLLECINLLILKLVANAACRCILKVKLDGT